MVLDPVGQKRVEPSKHSVQPMDNPQGRHQPHDAGETYPEDLPGFLNDLESEISTQTRAVDAFSIAGHIPSNV
jgi:hypothetical protein